MLEDSEVWANCICDTHKFKHQNRESVNPFTEKAYIFMQYAGLKDKNGRDIYEGDVVTSTSYTLGHMGSSEEKHAITKVIKYENGKYELLWNMYDTDLEVIGNIYENPGLLKDE